MKSFVRNALLTPRGVVLCYLTDERLQLRRNPWPSRTRLPAPEQPEPLTMPAEKGCRLHNSYDLAPIKPAPEPDQGEASGVGGTLGCGVMLLIQRELFAQEEVFCRKGWAGAQTEEEKSPRITHKREQEASKAHQVVEPSGIAGHREGSSQRQKVVVFGYYPS